MQIYKLDVSTMHRWREAWRLLSCKSLYSAKCLQQRPDKMTNLFKPFSNYFLTTFCLVHLKLILLSGLAVAFCSPFLFLDSLDAGSHHIALQVNPLQSPESGQMLKHLQGMFRAYIIAAFLDHQAQFLPFIHQAFLQLWNQLQLLKQISKQCNRF